MKLLPDMHRSDVVPEWETVPESEWNEHQRRAAETNGWDTPANRATLVGAAATLAGLALVNRDTKPSIAVGTALVAFGRIQDLRDGKIAAATGTKSPKGEAIDAGVDTFLMLVAAMTLKRSGILAEADADEMIANTGVKMGASLVGRLLGHEMHTGRMGKYGTFARWGGIGLSFLERVSDRFDLDRVELGDLEMDGITEKLGQTADMVMDIGLKMDKPATAGYVKDALFGHAPGLQ